MGLFDFTNTHTCCIPRPDLLDYRSCRSRTARQNLEHAFNIAERDLGVTKLLDPEDVDRPNPDEKSLITYISTLYELFPEPPENNPLLDNEKLKLIHDYKSLAENLVEWMDRSIKKLEERNFPYSMKECKRLQEEMQLFRSEEVPPRHQDKELLVSKYQDVLQMALALPVRIDDEYSAKNLEIKWTKVMQAYQKRDRDIKNHMASLDDLEQVAEKLRRNIKECNKRLNEIEIEVHNMHKYIQTHEPNEQAIEKIQNDLKYEDERIQIMFKDANYLCDKQHPQGKDLLGQVESLHKRHSAICLDFNTKILDALENRMSARMKAFEDFLSALHEKLLERERWINKKIYDSIPRDLDTLQNLIVEHSEFVKETKKFEVDIQNVQKNFEALPTKTPAFQKKFNDLMETWSNIHALSNKYVKQLEYLSVVLKDVHDASQLVSQSEIKLSKASDFPADLEQSKQIFHDYKCMYDNVQKHSGSFEKLLSNVSEVRKQVARNRVQQKTHADLDSLEENVKGLCKRWNSISTQVFER